MRASRVFRSPTLLTAALAVALTAQTTPSPAPSTTPATTARVPDPERIIFDTDSAYFNDDGAALVMLLQHPEITDVVGVTVVPGVDVLPRAGRRSHVSHLGFDEAAEHSPVRRRASPAGPHERNGRA